MQWVYWDKLSVDSGAVVPADCREMKNKQLRLGVCLENVSSGLFPLTQLEAD